jgi:hypothetical protein
MHVVSKDGFRDASKGKPAVQVRDPVFRREPAELPRRRFVKLSHHVVPVTVGSESALLGGKRFLERKKRLQDHDTRRAHALGEDVDAVLS